MRANRLLHGILAAAAIIVSGGCARDDGADDRTPADVDPSTAESRQIAGRAGYERVCANCHETGEDGAPRTGDADAWQDRSTLWEAVLYEHAKSGYIDMPARGGDADLSDPELEAAAEYMLSRTYPDRMPELD